VFYLPVEYNYGRLRCNIMRWHLVPVRKGRPTVHGL